MAKVKGSFLVRNGAGELSYLPKGSELPSWAVGQVAAAQVEQEPEQDDILGPSKPQRRQK